MQFSRFFRYENWVVQKMIVRLLLTMLGHVLREEPWGSWSGRGAGASMMFMSWVALKVSVMLPAAAGVAAAGSAS